MANHGTRITGHQTLDILGIILPMIREMNYLKRRFHRLVLLVSLPMNALLDFHGQNNEQAESTVHQQCDFN
ncbi:hypothetical protein ACTXT7_008044 [Hymenolepis weldensis]